jgi:hypothetical protein
MPVLEKNQETRIKNQEFGTFGIKEQGCLDKRLVGARIKTFGQRTKTESRLPAMTNDSAANDQ